MSQSCKKLPGATWSGRCCPLGWTDCLISVSDYIEESGRAVPTITKLVSVDKLLPLYNHKLSFSVFADF